MSITRKQLFENALSQLHLAIQIKKTQTIASLWDQDPYLKTLFTYGVMRFSDENLMVSDSLLFKTFELALMYGDNISTSVMWKNETLRNYIKSKLPHTPGAVNLLKLVLNSSKTGSNEFVREFFNLVSNVELLKAVKAEMEANINPNAPLLRTATKNRLDILNNRISFLSQAIKKETLEESQLQQQKLLDAFNTAVTQKELRSITELLSKHDVLQNYIVGSLLPLYTSQQLNCLCDCLELALINKDIHLIKLLYKNSTLFNLVTGSTIPAHDTLYFRLPLNKCIELYTAYLLNGLTLFDNVMPQDRFQNLVF